MSFVWSALSCLQIKIGEWTCPDGHVVQYDGGEDGLFSLRKSDDMGRVLLFARSFCFSLLSFVYNSRSTYSAATSSLASLRSSVGLRRQLIVRLGRCFVATLEPTPERFVCPKCEGNPDNVVIDGQALGFHLRDCINVARPALHLPSMNLKVDSYAIIREPRIRAAIRKVVKTGDRLKKTDAEALAKLHAALLSVRPRSQKASTIENWQLKRHAARMFFRFFEWTSVDDLGISRPRVVGSGGDSDRPGDSAVEDRFATLPGERWGWAAAVADGMVGGLGNVPAVSPTSVPWYARAGTWSPGFDSFIAAGTEWEAVRPFLLGLLGDPVVNIFAGQIQGPPTALAEELAKDDGGLWRKKSTASNAVAFVANIFARVGPLLVKEPALRKAAGALLLFAVDVYEVVDRDFQWAAQKASDAGQTKTLEFSKRCLGVTTPEDYEKYAAEHPVFRDQDLDSPYQTFEFFGFLKRVRPAIFTPRARPRRGANGQLAAGGAPRKGSQAALEDAGDRCSKTFLKHSRLTPAVFNIVCPHVVTMGFRVMFQAESVANALSLILERFPALPKVVFHDVACKIYRNGMQRVRSILSRHGVRFCIDRAHASASVSTGRTPRDIRALACTLQTRRWRSPTV